MNRIDAIISSMTVWERNNPDRIDRSRRHRIARGSGTDPSEINKLIKDFQAMSGMMQKMAGMGMMDRMRTMRDMAGSGMFGPGGGLPQTKERSKRGPLDQKAAEEKKKKARKEAKKQRKRNR
jgi:signal recognition particle subunit SRP54